MSATTNASQPTIRIKHTDKLHRAQFLLSKTHIDWLRAVAERNKASISSTLRAVLDLLMRDYDAPPAESPESPTTPSDPAPEPAKQPEPSHTRPDGDVYAGIENAFEHLDTEDEPD